MWRHWRGNVFSRISLRVCHSVCNATACKSFDLEGLFLFCWYVDQVVYQGH